MRWGRTIIIGSTLAAATLTCWSPTEMVIDLRTDVECGRRVRTGIAKGGPGLPLDATLETTTEKCTSVAGQSEIGTLTFVPSGDRDGRASVRIVMSVGPSITAERCLDKEVIANDDLRKSCIYASRTFSFLEHASRRLPIFLSQDCLGKICADDETCVPGRICKSNEVKCASDSCGLESEIGEDGGPPPSFDGASESSAEDVPSLDVDVSDAGEPCQKNGEIADKLPEASLVAASPSSVYFFEQATLRLWKVDKKTGAKTVLRDFSTNPGALAAVGLTTQNDFAIAAFTGPSTPYVWMEAFGASSALLSIGQSIAPIHVAALSNTTWPNVFAGVGPSTYRLNQDASAPAFELMASAPATRGLGATNTFVAAWTGVHVRGIHRTTGSVAGPTVMPPPKDVASTPSRVVASAEEEGGTNRGLFEIMFDSVNGTVGPRTIVSMPAPDSIDVDDSHVYFVTSVGSVARTTYDGLDAGVVVPSTLGRKLSFVLVDREPAGCIYYFTAGADVNDGDIRVLPKQ